MPEKTRRTWIPPALCGVGLALLGVASAIERGAIPVAPRAWAMFLASLACGAGAGLLLAAVAFGRTAWRWRLTGIPQVAWAAVGIGSWGLVHFSPPSLEEYSTPAVGFLDGIFVAGLLWTIANRIAFPRPSPPSEAAAP